MEMVITILVEHQKTEAALKCNRYSAATSDICIDFSNELNLLSYERELNGPKVNTVSRKIK